MIRLVEIYVTIMTNKCGGLYLFTFIFHFINQNCTVFSDKDDCFLYQSLPAFHGIVLPASAG
jgi:hypothetical protein